MSIGIIISFVTVLCIFALIGAHQKRAKRAIFLTIADKLDLNYSIERYRLYSRRPVLRGSFKGYDVKINQITYSSGEDSETHTQFHVFDHGINTRFSISREGFFNKIKKYFGNDDIQIGLKTLDNMFHFKSSNPAHLKAVFDEATQKRMLQMTRIFDGHVENVNGKILYTYPCNMTHKEEMTLFLKNIAFILLILNRFKDTE